MNYSATMHLRTNVKVSQVLPSQPSSFSAFKKTFQGDATVSHAFKPTTDIMSFVISHNWIYGQTVVYQ